MALSGMVWNPTARRWQTQQGVAGGGGPSAYATGAAKSPFSASAGQYNPFTPSGGGATNAGAFPGSQQRAAPTGADVTKMMSGGPYSLMSQQFGANEEARQRTQQGMYRAESALAGVQQRQQNSPLNAQLNQSIGASLANPNSLSPEIRAAMIQRTQDRLAEQRDQARSALSAQMANRGLSASSNYGTEFGNIEESYADALAETARDVEIEAARQAGTETRAAQTTAAGYQGQRYGQDLGLASQLASLLGSYDYQPEDYMSPMMGLVSAGYKPPSVPKPGVTESTDQFGRTVWTDAEGKMTLGLRPSLRNSWV